MPKPDAVVTQRAVRPIRAPLGIAFRCEDERAVKGTHDAGDVAVLNVRRARLGGIGDRCCMTEIEV